ncbi:MAG: hypothetical protein AAGA73_11000, partial [Pseudomonadota bacterium]
MAKATLGILRVSVALYASAIKSGVSRAWMRKLLKWWGLVTMSMSSYAVAKRGKAITMKCCFGCLSKHAQLLMTLTVALVFGSSALVAADGMISIELNKAEDTEQGCNSLFLFDNQSGHQL